MKTTTMMKGMMLAAMMTMSNAMMAATASNSRVNNHAGNRIETVHVQAGRGHGMVHDCNCHTCYNLQLKIDKHMRKHHGRQNRMTCRECMRLSQMQNQHAMQHTHHAGRIVAHH